jgi:hypothetical protein
VTVSGGCVLSAGEPADTILQLADACLYGAKAAGRNKIVTAALPTMDLISPQEWFAQAHSDRVPAPGVDKTVSTRRGPA